MVVFIVYFGYNIFIYGGNKMNEMNIYLQKNWKEITNKVRKVTKNHQNTDDLLNDLVVTLLDKPYDYQNDLLEKNKVQHWFTSAAHIQVNSKTSPFFYKYKSFNMRTTPYEEWMPVEEEENIVEKAEKVKMYISSQLETYNIYERTLATEHIMNQKSYSEISREYKINRRFISQTITPVKKEIFSKVKKKWE